MGTVIRVFLTLLFTTSAFAQYEGSITVQRMLLEVRVTKHGGEPVADLTPADFTVTVGGQPVQVASAVWNDEWKTGNPACPDRQDCLSSTPRLVIVFIQTDFTRQNLRVTRQMNFRRYAEQIVSSFQPDDRIAVVSFDSHLKFRCDLTTDREAAITAMRRAVLIDAPGTPAAVPEPSLAPLLDGKKMKDAVNTEEALLLVGEALRRIDGPKTLLLIGWGLGDHLRGVFYTKPAWKPARRALIDSRTTVIAVNTGLGGFLTQGLEMAAKQTGGFYVSAAELPQVVVNRVQKTLRGRYELELIAPAPIAAGIYATTVRVARRGVVVLAPDSISISKE
jgi:VWFA-related protein